MTQPVLQLPLTRVAVTHDAISSASRHIFSATDSANLDKILSNPPFASPPPNVLIKFLSLVGTVLGSLHPLVFAVAVILAVAIVLFVIYHMSHALAPHSRATTAETEFLGSMLADSPTARLRAEKAALHGDYRSAARYAFLATLLTLQESGIVMIADATGNTDILRQTRSRPHLYKTLIPVIHSFDSFWYGHVDVTQEAYLHYLQLNKYVLESAV